MDRPTLDDLQREKNAFIGPPEPPQGPKMPGSGPYRTPSHDEIMDEFPNLFQK
jgi:hypothetical protein